MRRITQAQALKICRQNGAFYTGHFIGTQGDKPGLGLHMPEYFDSRTLVTQPKVIEELAQGIAYMLAKYKVDTIVGMPIGALTLGHEVAKALDANYAMAEKSDGALVIHRSAFVQVVKGKRVALVEDTVCDGSTIRKGVKAVKDCGGNLVVIGGLINRGTTSSEELGIPFLTLINKPMYQISRQECMANGQCAQKVPINRRPAHGHDLEKLVKAGQVANDFLFV